MNTYLASILRHAFTALSGLGGFLFAKGLIDASDVTQVNASGVSLGAALAVILTAIGGRLFITLVGKIFSGGTGESGTGTSGWVFPFIACGTAAGLMGLLPSCSAANLAALKSIPFKGGITTDYGTAVYSSKSGIAIDVDATSGK